MTLNITQVKNTINRKFRGADIDDVRGISDYTIFREAASNILSRTDLFETIRVKEFDLFDGVTDYAVEGDLKGKKIIDIRPQSSRTPYDDFRQTFMEEFDRDKGYTDNYFSVEFDDADKFVRINKKLANSINVTSNTDDDYTATSGVSNITEDTILKIGGSNSIRFDVASGSNLLTWNGAASIDLSTHTNKSTFFLEVYWPDSSIITSITLRIGSDSSNYYEITGALQRGTVKDGINLYKFEWDGVSDSGSTDETAIDYVRLAIVTTAADTDVRIGKLSSKLPYPYEQVYYSNTLFRPVAGGSWLTTPTAVTDIVNVEQEVENIFIYECCRIIADDLVREQEAQKFRKLLGVDDFGRLTGGGLYGDYMSDKPSEAIRPNNRWYSNPKGGRGQFVRYNR